MTHTVYSDEKWVCFLFNQILLNSIKYRREHNPVVEFCTQEANGHVMLSIGITESAFRQRIWNGSLTRALSGAMEEERKRGSVPPESGCISVTGFVQSLALISGSIRRKAYTRRFFCIFPKKKPFKKYPAENGILQNCHIKSIRFDTFPALLPLQ